MKRKKVVSFILLIPWVLLLLAMNSVQAEIVLYVDDDGPSDGNGKSWHTAYQYLQDALAEAKDANKPAQVRIAQGVYKPTAGRFELINGVALKGGMRVWVSTQVIRLPP